VITTPIASYVHPCMKILLLLNSDVAAANKHGSSWIVPMPISRWPGIVMNAIPSCMKKGRKIKQIIVVFLMSSDGYRLRWTTTRSVCEEIRYTSSASNPMCILPRSTN